MKIHIIFAFFQILFISCNQRVGKPKLGVDTLSANAIINEEDTSEDQELQSILSSYEEMYTINKKIDTVFIRSMDTFHLIFQYYCLNDDQINVPSKYVKDYGIDSFITHNFLSTLKLFKNRTIIVNRKIEKSTFNNIIDESLRSYGVLLYPSLSINDSTLMAKYSISIPLTDVGKGVSYIISFSGLETIK